MTVVTELKLPTLPVETRAFSEDPMPYLEAARREHPWLAKCEIGYFVHGYQEMKDLLHMDAKLQPSHDDVVHIYGAEGTEWGRLMVEMMLNRSGADHARLRASVAMAFTPRNVNRHRPLIRKVISNLLDEWLPKGRLDFAEFASYFPISVLFGLMGTPPDAVPQIREALETQGLVLSLKRELLPRLLAGYAILAKYSDDLVAEREARGGELDEFSLLDTLIRAKRAGQIDSMELRFILILLLVAGYDTSKNMLTLIMHTMLSHPQYWERCADDREFCDKVVDEMFRHTSTATMYRTVVEDVDYDGIRFPKGSVLIFGNSIGGRDPRHFPDPMAFNPERTNANRHVAFGRGAHMCLGQHLAKTQIAEGVHVIAQRMTKPRLAGEAKWRPFLGVWGLQSLPIEFVPGPARESAI